MFGSIGGPELIVIFVVALLIFGPRKLPELGRMLGKGLSEFRRAANDLRDSLETEVAREQETGRPRLTEAAPPAQAVPAVQPAGTADSRSSGTEDARASGTAGAPDESGPRHPA
jgi:sec-independent protein translocase protein TatA